MEYMNDRGDLGLMLMVMVMHFCSETMLVMLNGKK